MTKNSSEEFICVNVYTALNELDMDVISRWRALEDRALDSNAYLSPDFIIPALKYLTPDSNFIIIAVDDSSNGKEKSIALGIFTIIKGTMLCPFTFLSAYNSVHSFLTGLLLDKHNFKVGLSILYSYIKNSKKWSAIEFPCRPVNKTTEQVTLDLLKSQGIKWHQFRAEKRAILEPKNSGMKYIKKSLSKQKIKNINRKKRRIEDMGKLEWKLIRGNSLTQETIQTFIRLENMGWKKQNGTSIASKESCNKFFLEMTNGFAKRNCAFFTELRLDDRVIASTCNFISGNSGFAFKLGWDDAFAKQSIGLLNEYELIRNAPELLSSLDIIDSSASPGTFLNELWKEKRTLVSGMYSLTTMASVYLYFLNLAIIIRNVLRFRS